LSIILANTFVINSSFIKITLLYFFINCTTGGLFLISLNDLSGEINSNLNKMPGGNSGAPIFQSSNNAGWNDWGNSKSLSYTFTKDYSSVMVYVSGGCSGYGMSSSEDQVKTSMYCNLYPGAGTISCTSGTIIKKNSYYIIQNVRSGSTVTMNFSTSGTQEVAIQAVIWEL
jgi:hypothetical protein